MVYLNLTAGAWAQMRRAWKLPSTRAVLREAYLAGPLRSLLAALQNLAVGKARLDQAEAIFVLGFWRSGTTLMHELLAADERFCFPSNYACFHPHHFVFSRNSRQARCEGQVRRPQDAMTTGWQTPQEDEFALLCLGARSPYEGLIAAGDFGRSLALTDPEDLPADEARRWENIFLRFFRAVRHVHGGKPVILKSPPHSYRVRTLRKLLPKSRFVLMVRDPRDVFESMMKTYRAFSLRYGLTPGLANRELREVILAERMRCEQKLEQGLKGLEPGRLTVVKFEDLVADPLAAVEGVYRELGLSGFDQVRPRLLEQTGRGLPPQRPPALPPPQWQARLADAWAELFSRYGYQAR